MKHEHIGKNFENVINFILSAKNSFKTLTSLANEYDFSKQQITQAYKSEKIITAVILKICYGENINLNYLTNSKTEPMFLDTKALRVPFFMSINDLLDADLQAKNFKHYFDINVNLYDDFIKEDDFENIIAVYNKFNREIVFLSFVNEINPKGVYLINYKSAYNMFCKLEPSISGKDGFFIITENETKQLKEMDSDFYVIAKALCSLKISVTNINKA